MGLEQYETDSYQPSAVLEPGLGGKRRQNRSFSWMVTRVVGLAAATAMRGKTRVRKQAILLGNMAVLCNCRFELVLLCREKE